MLSERRLRKGPLSRYNLCMAKTKTYTDQEILKVIQRGEELGNMSRAAKEAGVSYRNLMKRKKALLDDGAYAPGKASQADTTVTTKPAAANRTVKAGGGQYRNAPAPSETKLRQELAERDALIVRLTLENERLRK
jgi:hypothetical protein